MIYHGIKCASEVKNRFAGKRYTSFYHHSTKFRGKQVKWYEVIEDTAMEPVVVNRNNIRQFHIFFTQSAV